ncbi:50S ribosomal protein L29 [bacterium CG2_30_37_16]|nr:MAG: 50S ribosomal protein L29 [bacterium CG2_30_37_16]PIP30713.1 MAG: 50S ribosomal protein L29 [bacterium (Candidatus Howlettbacteria) CG23_combo_of_CG06-09_8_20_14_all_37_9]PIX99251.1 MAG: 50S ribosomal protein L29 [bacterium (Candidatus Howlettbacteria) CG_4_10_14_3_um_filter_37_10]PJB05568.1 MAG: 50S ribosomal protein L29 [bacterium (Candidatus Howlettbacteria) CG_4_9_14_3_um_filter_37_10]
MKYKEYIAKNDKQLAKDLADALKNLRELRFGIATREVKNTKAIMSVRKDIARILTLRKEREIAKALGEENQNES